MLDKQVQKAINNQDGNHLGDLVGWSLRPRFGSSADGIEIGQVRAQEVIKNLGLAKDFQFPKLTPTSAYRRAVRKAMSTKKTKDNYVAVKLFDNEDAVGHAIVKGEIVQQAVASGQIATQGGEYMAKYDASFDTALKSRCFKPTRKLIKTGVITSGDPEELLHFSDPDHAISKEITEWYRKLVVIYTADDIRQAFRRAFAKWNGMKVLRHGGLWWVPIKHHNKVNAWSKFVETIECDSIIVPTFETEETVDSLQRAAENSLANQLQTLREDLGKFASNTRTKTMEKRFDEFSSLRRRAELYKDVLGLEVQEITDSIKTAEQSLTKMLGEKDD
jgi:hypothetical protein